jgi:hypothetical protein
VEDKGRDHAGKALDIDTALAVAIGVLQIPLAAFAQDEGVPVPGNALDLETQGFQFLPDLGGRESQCVDPKGCRLFMGESLQGLVPIVRRKDLTELIEEGFG